MNRFKNILIVYNGKYENHALIDHAVDLAKRNQAVLTIVDVIEEPSSDLVNEVIQVSKKDITELEIPILEEFSSSNPLSPAAEFPFEDQQEKAGRTIETPIEIKEFIFQQEQQSFQEFVAKIQQAGIRVRRKTLYGVPFVKIIQEVLHEQHDLVLITADGSGDFKETLFGSTTLHLMRKCPCPVWVIKSDHVKKFNRILAAVDVVQGDTERSAIAKRILEMATSLARIGKSELLIVHAWSMYGESILRGRGQVSNENIENLLQETRKIHRRLLGEFLQMYPLGDLRAEVYMLKGDPGKVITEFAEVKAPDLIIMGTVSRTGISGLLIGNTAEYVLRQVNCSVLTVKPEGFISPVK